MTELTEVLKASGVPPPLIDREIASMQPISYGRTNNRSVLGTMTDFILNFRYMLSLGKEHTLLDWSLFFAQTPCGPGGKYDFPETLAPQLINDQHGFEVIQGGKP